jgi:hypothetical protein
MFISYCVKVKDRLHKTAIPYLTWKNGHQQNMYRVVFLFILTLDMSS